MLYNIIDRIYIGHIPGSGALALTGVGVCMAEPAVEKAAKDFCSLAAFIYLKDFR